MSKYNSSNCHDKVNFYLKYWHDKVKIDLVNATQQKWSTSENNPLQTALKINNIQIDYPDKNIRWTWEPIWKTWTWQSKAISVTLWVRFMKQFCEFSTTTESVSAFSFPFILLSFNNQFKVMSSSANVLLFFEIRFKFR